MLPKWIHWFALIIGVLLEYISFVKGLRTGYLMYDVLMVQGFIICYITMIMLFDRGEK